MDTGDVCITVWMYLMPLNGTLRNGWNSKLYTAEPMCMHAQSLSHVWLCNPMDCSPPGFSVPGILQARVLEWVAISSSRGSSWPRDRTWVSCTGRRILYHCTTKHPHIYTSSHPCHLFKTDSIFFTKLIFYHEYVNIVLMRPHSIQWLHSFVCTAFYFS